MNNPLEDMPPLFDPSDLTRCLEKTFQLIDEMKRFDRPPSLGEVKPILQRLKCYQESRLLINSSALKVLMQRLTEYME